MGAWPMRQKQTEPRLPGTIRTYRYCRCALVNSICQPASVSRQIALRLARRRSTSDWYVTRTTPPPSLRIRRSRSRSVAWISPTSTARTSARLYRRPDLPNSTKSRARCCSIQLRSPRVSDRHIAASSSRSSSRSASAGSRSSGTRSVVDAHAPGTPRPAAARGRSRAPEHLRCSRSHPRRLAGAVQGTLGDLSFKPKRQAGSTIRRWRYRTAGTSTPSASWRRSVPSARQPDAR